MAVRNVWKKSRESVLSERLVDYIYIYIYGYFTGVGIQNFIILKKGPILIIFKNIKLYN